MHLKALFICSLFRFPRWPDLTIIGFEGHLFPWQLFLSYPVSSCLVLSRLVLTRLVLPCLVLHCAGGAKVMLFKHILYEKPRQKLCQKNKNSLVFSSVVLCWAVLPFHGLCLRRNLPTPPSFVARWILCDDIGNAKPGRGFTVVSGYYSLQLCADISLFKKEFFHTTLWKTRHFCTQRFEFPVNLVRFCFFQGKTSRPSRVSGKTNGRSVEYALLWGDALHSYSLVVISVWLTSWFVLFVLWIC